MHTTKAYIPMDVAKALLANPALVQKAVETFYTRDAIQLRVSVLYKSILCLWHLMTYSRLRIVCRVSHQARTFCDPSR